MVCFKCFFGVVFIGSFITSVSCYNSSMEDIYVDLFKDYNKKIIPKPNDSSPLQLWFSFTLLYLQDINTVDGVITLAGFFFFHWVDKRLIWDPSIYNNLSSIVVPSEDIWKPYLINGNTAMEFVAFGNSDSYVRIMNNGQILWMPGHRFEFVCVVDPGIFPFDTQECHLYTLSWIYDSSDIMFTIHESGQDTGFYHEHNEWDLVFTSVNLVPYDNPGFNLNMHFKRRPLFSVINLIFPIVFLAVLNPCVLLLPQISGERIGFAVTILLANVVFLTIAQTMLPATVEPRVPAICILLLGNQCYSGLIVLVVIFSSKLFHRSDKEKIPVHLQKFVSIFISPSRVDNQVVDVKNTSDINSNFDAQNWKVNQGHATWEVVSTIFDKICFYFFLFVVLIGVIAFIIDVNTN